MFVPMPVRAPETSTTTPLFTPEQIVYKPSHSFMYHLCVFSLLFFFCSIFVPFAVLVLFAANIKPVRQDSIVYQPSPRFVR